MDVLQAVKPRVGCPALQDHDFRIGELDAADHCIDQRPSGAAKDDIDVDFQ
jgi:hypothetical protein